MNRFTSLMQQINYVLFFVLVATLPLPRNIMLWCWVAWGISWLLEGRWLHRQNIQWGKRMIPSLVLCGMVLWECISLIWASNQGGGSFPDNHISFLLLPIITLYGLNEHYDWKKIAKVYIIGCVCSFFLYCWLLYWVGNYNYVFSSSADSQLLPLQPAYFDNIFSIVKHRMVYCSALGVAIMLLFVLRKDLIAEWGKWKAYLFMFGSLGVMLTAILATGSRANLLTLVIIGALAWISQIKRYKPLVVSAIVLVGIGCCLAIWKFHPRMKDLTINQVTHVEEHFRDPDMQPRLLLWHFALQNPKDYIVHGVGAGNVATYIDSVCEQYDVPMIKHRHLSSHNQYLYLCIELGLAAMLLFIFFWYYIPFCFPKGSTARRLAMYLVIFLGINMLTDDILSWVESNIYICVYLLIIDLMAKAETDTPPLNA